MRSKKSSVKRRRGAISTHVRMRDAISWDPCSGVITTNYEKILNSASDYYKQLYSSKSNQGQVNTIDSFFKNLNIPKLSEEQRTSCEGLISKEEQSVRRR